jgi:hypothetical protein
VTVPGQLSVAVTEPGFGIGTIEAQKKDKLDGQVMDGAIVSFTVMV